MEERAMMWKLQQQKKRNRLHNIYSKVQLQRMIGLPI